MTSAEGPRAPWADAVVLYALCGAVLVLPVSISIATILAYVAFAATLLSGRVFEVRKRWLPRGWSPRGWLWPVLALVAITWIGLLYTVDMRLGLRFAGKTHYWLLALPAVTLAHDARAVRTLAASYVLGISLSSVYYLLRHAGLVQSDAGVIWHITYSLFLVFGIMLIVFFFKTSGSGRGRVFLVFLFALLFLNLLLSTGRAGHLAFVLVLPFLLLYLFGTRHALKVALACVLIVAAMGVSPMVRERVMNAVEDIKEYQATGDAGTSLGGRFHMWKRAVAIFTENPVLGAGTGSYRKLMERHKVPSYWDTRHWQPHNMFLHMAASHGLVGVAVLVWLFAVLLRTGWRMRGTARGFALLSYVSLMLIASLTDSQLLQPHSALLLAIVTGLGSAEVGRADAAQA
jgi:O-antigen ligase